MARELATVNAMIRLYCCGNHHTQSNQPLCAECQALKDYATQRLERCPFQQGKTSCAKCPVHCYRPEMRQRIRTVMRYSGPRMLLHHPIMAIFHLIDGARKQPIKKSR
jgi:predicted amidophosphoribosyltransferase